MKKLAQFDAALARFQEALELPPDPIARDSAILRFELVFETCWKACQELAREAGVVVSSPREAFRAAFQLGWTDDEEFWPRLLQERNLIVHTYNEGLAEQLYARLKLAFPKLADLNAAMHKASQGNV